MVHSSLYADDGDIKFLEVVMDRQEGGLKESRDISLD